MIDTYDDALAQIYHEKYGAVEKGPVPAIKFKGLKHIFMEDPATLAGLKESWLMGVQMPHPVKTEIDNEVEVCRKLMLGVAGADRKFIRSCIDQQEEHAVSLYRGQTRFMLEDLAGVPSIKSLSNKQKKKTAALVAEEMMSRNQGYSNLTELLLTNYVRLSIHAHDNSGPKFAVRLLPKTMVRPIQDLEKRHEPVAAYEFQLPTPWHNTIIKVEGDEYIYLARSEIAKKAIAGTDYEGSWVEGPEGGHYSLTRKPAALMKRPTLALVTKQGINHVKQRVREMRTPQKTSAPFSPKPLSRTKTQPLFSPMCAEPVAWVTPVEKPAHPFTPLAERRVKTIFTPAPGTFKDPPTPIAQKGRSATGFVSSKSTASASSSSNGKITILPLPDKVKSILSDKSKTPPPAEQPKPSTVATVVEEQEPVTPPPEVVNAPAAAKPDITVAPAAEQPATTTTAATVTSAPAAEPQSTTPSEKTEVAPVSIKAQKRQTFYNIFSQKATATVTPINEKLTVETQSNVKRRSAFGNFMKRLGVVQSPA